jgi:hypothetical protein
MKGGTNMTQLYAWRRPAFFSSDEMLDHTYVTDYSPFNKYLTIQSVITAGEHYFYCWGDFDMKNKNQYLVPKCPASGEPADLKRVSCICEANDKDAHGTIFKYLKDGVCHQLTNQVLYPTEPRITVEGVKGWQLSYFFYTVYGMNDKWNMLVKRCMGGVKKMPKGKKYIDKVDSLIEKLTKKKASKKVIKREELNLFIYERLGKRLSRKKRDFLSEVMEETDKVRRHLYDEMEKGNITPAEFAEGVNKLHDGQLLRIADKIGRDDYIKLFGAPPEKPVHLADPKFARVFFR